MQSYFANGDEGNEVGAHPINKIPIAAARNHFTSCQLHHPVGVKCSLFADGPRVKTCQ
jgi:hypothetical protein